MTVRTFSVSPDAMARELAGETVILHLASGRYFGLDEVGTRIWQLLAEGHGCVAIARQICSEYEVEPDQARQDVRTLLDRLEAAQLIVPGTAANVAC